MKEQKEKFSENINEVIKPGGETDFVFFVKMNNGQLVQKILPSFMKNSFKGTFGNEVPNEIEFNIWFKKAQSNFNKNESNNADLLLG